MRFDGIPVNSKDMRHTDGRIPQRSRLPMHATDGALLITRLRPGLPTTTPRGGNVLKEISVSRDVILC